jgi:hypothetical protein
MVHESNQLPKFTNVSSPYILSFYVRSILVCVSPISIKISFPCSKYRMGEREGAYTVLLSGECTSNKRITLVNIIYLSGRWIVVPGCRMMTAVMTGKVVEKIRVFTFVKDILICITYSLSIGVMYLLLFYLVVTT